MSLKIDTTQILTFEFYTVECISRPIKVIDCGEISYAMRMWKRIMNTARNFELQTR